MLVNSESRFKKGDIIAIKNILGEEIICEYIEEDDTGYTVKTPFAMAMSPGGQPGFAPPVMFMADPKDKELTPIRKEHVLFAFPAKEDITNAYKAETTGIVPATAQETKIIAG